MATLLGDAGLDRTGRGRPERSVLDEDVLPFDEVEDCDLAPCRPVLTSAPGFDEPRWTWSFRVTAEPPSEETPIIASASPARPPRRRKGRGPIVAFEPLTFEPVFEADLVDPIEWWDAPSQSVEPVDLRPWQAPGPADPEPQTTTQAAPREPWRGPSRFAQACVACRHVVPVGAGSYRSDGEGGWEVIHYAGTCVPERS